MKNILNFLKKIDKKYLILGSIVVLFLALPPLINIFLQKPKPRVVLTEPLLNTSTPSAVVQAEPLSENNIFNPKQRIIITWNNPDFQIPSTMTGYRVEVPLINPGIINKTSEAFGFTVGDTQKTLSDMSFMWKNTTASLFASLTQNQIFYKKSSIPERLNPINKDESIKTADNVLQKIFGDPFVKNLDDHRTTKLFLQTPGAYDAQITDADKANLIQIGYTQAIDSKPVVSLGTSTDTLNLTLDTQRNIYKLDVYGGFLSVRQTEEIPLVDFEELKQRAADKSRRISNIEDIHEGNDIAFSSTPLLYLTVSSIRLGYFQRNDNILFPVFLIAGTMSAKNLPDTPAEFLVPAAK